MRIVHAVFVLPLFAVTIPSACASSNETLGWLPGDDGGNESAAPEDASGRDAPMLFGDGAKFGDGATGCSAPTCSTDLHNIVCNGMVVQTCPPDQGCSSGKCVPACQAAQDSKSNIGCDYYSVNPDTTFAAGACFAAFVANTWTGPVTIQVDYGGMPISGLAFAAIPQGTGQSITYQPLTNGQLQPEQIAILFLAQYGTPAVYKPACPPGITPAISMMDAAPHLTSIGSAFHISTTAPVVAYDIFPYGGGVSAITSATLLLPTTVWDTNYIAVDAYPAPPGGGYGLSPLLDIVAATDNTHVTVAPTVAIEGGSGVASAAQGVPTTYTLQKGQVLHFNQGAELVGSPIQSDNPVGVWGGNACMDVPVDVTACDSAHQQIPPVKALGNEYVAVRYRNRFAGQEESVPWRLVGAVAGTTLTYEPSPPIGAPATLTVGQMAEFTTSGPFVVRSQDAMHPFYLAGYMTGSQQVDQSGGDDARGDPEFVNVLPPQQFLTQYIFFTDPTYPETDLVLVRAQASDGTFKDVTLDCLGTTPVSGWMPVGTSGKYQYTRLDLVTGNFMPIGNCNNGRHEMTSTGPFGLTVWGWGSAATGGSGDPNNPMPGFYSQYVSYAYPAGASVQPINGVVVPPINQ